MAVSKKDLKAANDQPIPKGKIMQRLTVTDRFGKEVHSLIIDPKDRTEVHEDIVRQYPHSGHFYFCEQFQV